MFMIGGIFLCLNLMVFERIFKNSCNIWFGLVWIWGSGFKLIVDLDFLIVILRLFNILFIMLFKLVFIKFLLCVVIWENLSKLLIRLDICCVVFFIWLI